ncbi:MAG TPA: LysR family transcriptional regulator ArgP [Dehalococcoidia bacterium]|nr:LysR family transcriptional regulator ArgP [Dehalococcoidia bacterium]
MERVFDQRQLQALAAIVSEGTFEAAAQRLHVTPSAISQRVKALEANVGRVLLSRTRPLRATPSGETLLRAARQIESVMATAAQELGSAGSGEPAVLTLAVNADSLALWLVRALARVNGVVFELRREDESRTAQLLREGSVMAAITAMASPVPGCTVVPLGRMRYHACASPEFAGRWFPHGASTQALSITPLVAFDRDDLLQQRYLRKWTKRRLAPPVHFVPGTSAYVEAVREGLGWGMVPALQAVPLMKDGLLVEIDAPRSVDVPLFWQQWRLRSHVLDAVADAVRVRAAEALAL